MRKVPFVDLGPQTAAVKADVLRSWEELFTKSAFSGGEYVERFERAWAAYLAAGRADDAVHAVGCSDGTAAIVLALRGLDIGPGDEVVCPPTSFFATAEAVALVGATPTFADVDPATGNFDPSYVEAALTPRTRAIIAVHLAGRPAPLAELRAIADRRGLRLVEDAAQAQGAEYGGRRVGTLSDAGTFSFYPTKNLGAFGEGGAVVTRDAALARRVRALRDHGQTSRHRHEHIGYNARLHGMQACVLESKIAWLDRWNDERRAIADRYRRALEGVPIGLPPPLSDGRHVYHLFAARTSRRDGLAAHLGEAGVGTGSHYPTPIHLQPAFAHLGHRPGAFPNAERYASEQLSLPLYPGLPAESVDWVAGAIRAFFTEGARA
jgi:dTDP-4-amino-4,6-dideoxygalactose transaminase